MTTTLGEDANADPRVRALLESSLRDVGDRPLAELLHDVVSCACEVLECRYAAITVLGSDGGLEHFVPFGGDPSDAERIGRFPDLTGLLGTVAEHGTIVRIPDIAVDARGVGLPPNHPVIHSLLGVPIIVRGRSGGGLYLSELNDRRHFAAADERTAELLASAAANLVEKARTVAANRRRDRWLIGATELTHELVLGDHSEPLRRVVDRVLEIADADLVTITQRGPDPDTLHVSAAAGERAGVLMGRYVPRAGSSVAEVLDGGRPLLIANYSETDNVMSGLDLGAVILAPLVGSGDARGVLAIARCRSRQAFTAAEVGMATMFAGNVALALELDESRLRRDQLALIEERDRIARDLHDHVIQRLFAVGLGLQNARSVGPTPARLNAAVDEIDATIRQIRSTIYRLTLPIVSPENSLRTRATRLIDELTEMLGFRAQLTVEGPVDFGVGADLVDDCIAVLREALTNIARHAQATRALVAMTVSPTSICIEVQDDGRGIGSTGRRSGLANLRTRAERRNGSLEILPNGVHGTRLVWTIPTTEW